MAPNPDAHPLVQAQLELLRVLPSVIRPLASIWEAFNRFSTATTTVAGTSQPPELPWPAPPAISLPRLPKLTALGTSTPVRSTIRMFIEPIALHHPDSFLISFALCWPPNLIECSDDLNDSESRGLLGLLTPTNLDNGGELDEKTNCHLPLLPDQASLLRFLSGHIAGGTSLGLFVPINTFVKHLRELIRQPLTNVALLIQLAQIKLDRSAFNSQNSPRSTASSKQQVKQHRSELRTRLQVNLLHIFYAWLICEPRTIPPDLIFAMLRDLISIPVDTSSLGISAPNTGILLPPVAIFVLVKIFAVYLQFHGTTEDRREQRELQELCHRVLESATAVAASALEQASWFRRTLQVRQSSSPVPPPKSSENDLSALSGSLNGSSGDSALHNCKSAADLITKDLDSCPPASLQSSIDIGSYSKPLGSIPSSSTALLSEQTQSRIHDDLAIQAMELLAEHMATSLDVVYKSDEKDRIPAFLAGILTSIFPYLRVRTLTNSNRFTAASKLLASISGYQYSRRAWRREVLDLFFEPVFFQMDATALQSWTVIMDNLMTQDKNTFKEALMRLTFSPSGTLSLFANREAEHELRAACLKKLSYIIYASEVDQYAKAMPDLLERLTECLRLGQGIVPQVHAQVFFFARVLISRMSAIQLTSLWPIIVPELIIVFRSLVRHVEKSCTQPRAKQENRPLSTATEPSSKEMSMYLSACKFLATGLLCSEDRAPQFSYYQWIFVNEAGITRDSQKQMSEGSEFSPLISSVTKFLRRCEEQKSSWKGPSSSNFQPLQGCIHMLAVRKLNDFSQLSPFLYSLDSESGSPGVSDFSDESGVLVHLALEASLAQEFPEPVGAR